MFSLIIISIIGYCLITTKIFRWPIESAPLFVVSTIIALLYVASLSQILQFASYAVFGIGVLSFVVSCLLLYRNRQDLLNIYLTPGFVIFCILVFLLWFKVHNAIFNTFDEFAQWGMISKYVYLHNALTADFIAPKYPPGLALFHYYFYQLLGYSEGVAYFAQDILILAATIVLLQRFKWRQIIYVIVTLLFCYFAIFAFGHWSYNPVSGGYGELLTLTADTIVGLFFGVGIAVYLLSQNKNAAIYRLIPIIFCLPLIKLVGLFFGAIIIILVISELVVNLFFRINHNRQFFMAFVCGCFLLPLILMASCSSWFIYTKTIATNDVMHYVNNTKKLQRSTWRGKFTKHELITINKFSKATKTLKVGTSIIKTSFTKSHAITTIDWTIILLLFSGFVFFTSKSSPNRFRIIYYNLWIILGLVIYLLALLLTYLHMDANDSDYLAAYSRYIGTYFLSWSMIIYALTIHLIASQKTISIKNILCLSVLPLLCFLAAPAISLDFIIKQPRTLISSRFISDRSNLHGFVTHLNSQVNINKKVYIISQWMPIFLYQIMKYEAIPRKINNDTWSVGVPRTEIDFWTKNISPQNLKNRLKKYDYLVIIETNDYFCQKYKNILSKTQSCDFGGIYKIALYRTKIFVIPRLDRGI